MNPVTLGNMPSFVAHGTREAHVEGILANGVIPGGPLSQRTFCHFTVVPPNSGKITGLPIGAEVLIHLDLSLWLLHG